jgi:mRNA interferase RelE/StbE
VSYEVIWEPEALAQAERFAKDDPEGVRQVFTAVDRLADEPRPEGAFAFGSTDVLRIHVGIYRVMYEISDQQVRVGIIHLGRLR